jgi:hypothetical protein
MHWSYLLELGDIALTAPAAAAISTWMVAARAGRPGRRGGLLFGVGIAIVATSKIAFLGWGAGVPALQFRAISGHATGVMAVYPVLFYLLLQDCPPALRRLGAAIGVALGLLMAALLVLLCEHSAAESLAGCALGAAVSLGGIRLAAQLRGARAWPALACAALMFAGAAWLMGHAPVGWWMIKAARLLSGQGAVHSFHSAALE